MSCPRSKFRGLINELSVGCLSGGIIIPPDLINEEIKQKLEEFKFRRLNKGHSINPTKVKTILIEYWQQRDPEKYKRACKLQNPNDPSEILCPMGGRVRRSKKIRKSHKKSRRARKTRKYRR
jgi:hypothetical protein